MNQKTTIVIKLNIIQTKLIASCYKFLFLKNLNL
jgi:hypothetical protein